MPKKKPASKRKRAANGQGSINQRADGRYKIDVSLGYNPTTGKAIRKSVYGWTQDEALAKAQKLKVSANDGVFTEPSKLTVGQWLDIWHKEYLGNVKPDTASQYETYIRVHIKPALGRIKLSALSPHAIQSVYNKQQRAQTPESPCLVPLLRFPRLNLSPEIAARGLAWPWLPCAAPGSPERFTKRYLIYGSVQVCRVPMPSTAEAFPAAIREDAEGSCSLVM